MEELHLEWYAPEYEHRTKGVAWHWASMGVALVVLLFALWQQNYIFAVFIVLAEVLLIIWANREPRSIHFIITDQALEIDKKRSYRWESLAGFGIIDDLGEDHQRLIFFRKENLRPALHIPLPQAKRTSVEIFLENKLPREEASSSLIDALDHLIQF